MYRENHPWVGGGDKLAIMIKFSFCFSHQIQACFGSMGRSSQDNDADDLLGKDFYGRYVAFHVEHFGTVVTAQQVTPVDTDSTPVLIGVVLFPPRVFSSSRRPILVGHRHLVCASVRERSAGRAAVLLGA